jgi:hypothetical protein
MRLALPLAIAALTIALLSGCGSPADGGDSGSISTAPEAGAGKAPAGASAHECSGRAGEATALRATGVSCAQAEQLARAWAKDPGCAPGEGASRSSCRLEGDYDCLAAATGRGLAVSCARPGGSVAFTVRSS